MSAFRSQITSSIKGLLISIFMKEIRLVVTEKIVFVSGDESKLIAPFGIFGLSILISRFKEHKKATSQSASPPKVVIVRWRP